jgi:phosphomannomutase
VDLGLVSTPVIQHAARQLGAAGGISIGASHNTAEWNALKFFAGGGSYLSTAQAGELLDIYHLKKFEFAEWNRIGKLTEDGGAIDSYLDELAAAYDFNALRRFRVLVDCTNGTSARILRRLNERHGFALILINERMEGAAFAHPPATNRRMVELQLAPLMRHAGADAGFLFDVDSDRVALATETGEAVSEEMVLPLLADERLRLGPGKIVIANLSSTALLEEIAARHGGHVVRVPVGRQAAIDALATYRPEQVAIAGEGTGAVMMPRFRFVYDGIAAMLEVLSMLARRGRKLSELLGEFPRYSILKGEAPLETRRIPHLLFQLERRYFDAHVNSVDGLRLDWPGRWVHVRVSQTEPIVRVIAEQRGAPPTALFEEVLDFVRSYAA